MSNNNLPCDDCGEEHHPAGPCQPEPESAAVLITSKGEGMYNGDSYWVYPESSNWFCGLCGYGKKKCSFHEPTLGDDETCVHTLDLKNKDNPLYFSDFCFSLEARKVACSKK